MIVCDGQHKEQVEGLPSLKIRGETKIGQETAQIEFAMSIRGKQYCKECMLDRVKKVNLPVIIKDAKKAENRRGVVQR